VEGLTIRKARPEDTERIAEILAGDPSQEVAGLIGDAGKARALGMGWARMPNSTQGWPYTVVAETEGRVVGIIQAGGNLAEFRITPAAAWLAIRILGPLGVLAALPRMRARDRVQPPRLQNSYHVAEIEVDPQCRNQGIGGALLEYAERDAREKGYEKMSLVTTTINPARRLYERHGYRVTDKRTDAKYKRYTGIEGRVRMVKELQ
jgi:ribosomal protein S18 acetylase RimI-like enzyme